MRFPQFFDSIGVSVDLARSAFLPTMHGLNLHHPPPQYFSRLSNLYQKPTKPHPICFTSSLMIFIMTPPNVDKLFRWKQPFVIWESRKAYPACRNQDAEICVLNFLETIWSKKNVFILLLAVVPVFRILIKVSVVLNDAVGFSSHINIERCISHEICRAKYARNLDRGRE